MKKMIVIAALMLASTMMYGQLRIVQGKYYDYYEFQIGDFKFTSISSADNMTKYGCASFSFDELYYRESYHKKNGKVLNLDELYNFADGIIKFITENKSAIEEKYKVKIYDIHGHSFKCYPDNIEELIEARNERLRKEKAELNARVAKEISEIVL